MLRQGLIEPLCLSLGIADSNTAAASRRLGQDLTALLDIHDSRARWANSRAARDSLGIGERHSSEVGEGNQGAAALEVLNNPLSVGLAEISIIDTGELVGDRCARSEVFDDSRAGVLGLSSHSELDHISSGDGDAGEIVGIIRVPLVPGIVGNLASLDAEINSSLEDGGVASVTVDTDPGGGAVLLARRSTGGKLRLGNGEFTGDRGVLAANKHSTGPVGAVLLLGGSVHLEKLLGVGLVSRTADTLGSARSAGSFACCALLGERSCDSRRCEQRGAEDGSGELHGADWKIGLFD